MATKTAVEIADDIRRVEYAIYESENLDLIPNDFTSSDELALFWAMVDSLEIQRTFVEIKFNAVSNTKFSDLVPDV